jgi:hypothetical protein
VNKITLELKFPENGQMNGKRHSSHFLAATDASERRENVPIKELAQ